MSSERQNERCSGGEDAPPKNAARGNESVGNKDGSYARAASAPMVKPDELHEWFEQ